ncbi:MAG: glycosyltransferase family A protein [Pseudomonadota bacterium]
MIIPTYRSWDALELCLDCLARQDFDPARYEVIVVNNDPDDPVPDNLPRNAPLRVISEARPGSYAARNAGIRAARADVLFFTDADCRPHSDYLSTGWAVVEDHPDTFRFAGGIELVPQGDEWTPSELYDRIKSLDQARYASQNRAATANVFMRRAAFEMVGLFDETRLSGGDMEWAERATTAGLALRFAPDVKVDHPARASFEDNLTKARRLLGGRIAAASGPGRLAFYLPPLRRLLPSVGIRRLMARESGISVDKKRAVIAEHNRIRRALIWEQLRLTWLRTEKERR